MTKKISELTQLTAVADDDIIPLVDVSDTTMGATGTTKYIERDDLIRAPYNAMSRQAIMNGNFDIWQRGTSVALADATQSYQADRWFDVPVDDGGTLPTLTRSRQLLTSGDIANSFFYTRLATNGAGTSLGNGSYHEFSQKIENGTRNLCGLNKNVTLSFYARSSIANKKIGVYLAQVYGTGGSPSSAEIINGTNWTLTSTWTKYEYTFTTNTLVGKTFGTNYDDYLTVSFFNMWGSTYQDRVGASTTETYVGSGNIDIAQVQLNAGDEALEFNPKSYEEELRACQTIISPDLGWTPVLDTWVYASATTFTIAGVDRTNEYRKGGKIRWKQGGAYKYAYILSSAFSTDTTVTITGGSDYTIANSAITDNYVSYEVSPLGFPVSFAYTPVVTTGSGSITTQTVVGDFSITGGMCWVVCDQLIVNVGTGGTSLLFSLPVNCSSNIALVHLMGRESGVTGKLLNGQCGSDTQVDKLYIADGNNVPPLTNNYRNIVSGSYPIA